LKKQSHPRGAGLAAGKRIVYDRPLIYGQKNSPAVSARVGHERAAQCFDAKEARFYLRKSILFGSDFVSR
jgi:hypothetical protein